MLPITMLRARSGEQPSAKRMPAEYPHNPHAGELWRTLNATREAAHDARRRVVRHLFAFSARSSSGGA
jgi:hypothetical protein